MRFLSYWVEHFLSFLILKIFLKIRTSVLLWKSCQCKLCKIKTKTVWENQSIFHIFYLQLLPWNKIIKIQKFLSKSFNELHKTHWKSSILEPLFHLMVWCDVAPRRIRINKLMKIGKLNYFLTFFASNSGSNFAYHLKKRPKTKFQHIYI